MPEILYLEKVRDRFILCVEEDDFYKFLLIDKDGTVEEADRYGVVEYQDTSQFIDIMGKFHPEILFLRTPIIVTKVDYSNLDRAWNEREGAILDGHE